jgi:hypothetical protein
MLGRRFLCRIVKRGRIFAVFHGFISFARRRPARGGDSSEVSNPSCKDWGHPILYSCLFAMSIRVFLRCMVSPEQMDSTARQFMSAHLPTPSNDCGDLMSEPPATHGHEWPCCEGCLVCHRLASLIVKSLLWADSHGSSVGPVNHVLRG